MSEFEKKVVGSERPFLPLHLLLPGQSSFNRGQTSTTSLEIIYSPWALILSRKDYTLLWLFLRVLS